MGRTAQVGKCLSCRTVRTVLNKRGVRKHLVRIIDTRRKTTTNSFLFTEIDRNHANSVSIQQSDEEIPIIFPVSKNAGRHDHRPSFERFFSGKTKKKRSICIRDHRVAATMMNPNVLANCRLTNAQALSVVPG